MNPIQRLVLMREEARNLAITVANAAVSAHPELRTRRLAHVCDRLDSLVQDIETLQHDLFSMTYHEACELASTRASELDGPNSPDYDRLCESILEELCVKHNIEE